MLTNTKGRGREDKSICCTLRAFEPLARTTFHRGPDRESFAHDLHKSSPGRRREAQETAVFFSFFSDVSALDASAT